MTSLIPYDFTRLQKLFSRPALLNEFAHYSMGQVEEMLQHSNHYNCSPSCNRCCYGSILMSYTEFNYIWIYLEQCWSSERINELLQLDIKRIQGDSTIRCPFLASNKAAGHCKIYQARPLICRAFGTTAAPCDEDIEPVPLNNSLFYRAYDQLYYANNQFIALTISDDWALFEAPFAFWCLADSDESSRQFLTQFIQDKNDTFHAVLYDLHRRHFFAISKGEHNIISR